MIDGHRVVAVVPARGGSKGVPRKNVRDLGGKPLLAWSVELALDTPEVDRVIVSTDDDEIAAVAREYGAEVSSRPAELAADDAIVADALRHLIGELRAEGEAATYLVLLEPTCPFRSSEDVSACLRRLVDDGYDSVATFVEAELNPYRAWTLDDGHPEPVIPGANPWLPRQELPDAYQLNGGVYAFVADRLPPEGGSLLFGTFGGVPMPADRSVDVDSELDLELARLHLERGVADEMTS